MGGASKYITTCNVQATHMNALKCIPGPFWNLEGRAVRECHIRQQCFEGSPFKKPAKFTNSLHNTLFIKTHKLALF